MTLGEFRKMTKDLSDDKVLYLVHGDHGSIEEWPEIESAWEVNLYGTKGRSDLALAIDEAHLPYWVKELKNYD